MVRSESPPRRPLPETGDVGREEPLSGESVDLASASQVSMGVGLTAGSTGDMLDLLQPNKFLDGDDDDLSKFISALHVDAVFSKYFPDDDEQDPDYDFFAGELEIDDNEKETEEYRADRAVIISRREVQLLQKSQRQFHTQGTSAQALDPPTDKGGALVPDNDLGLPSLQAADLAQHRASSDHRANATRRVSTGTSAPPGGVALSLPDSLPPLPLPPTVFVSNTNNANTLGEGGNNILEPLALARPLARINPHQRARLADQIRRLAQILIQFKIFGDVGVDPYNGQLMVEETTQLAEKVCIEARKWTSHHSKVKPKIGESLFDPIVIKDLQLLYAEPAGDIVSKPTDMHAIKPLYMPPDAGPGSENRLGAESTMARPGPPHKPVISEATKIQRGHGPPTILPKDDKSAPSVLIRHDGLQDLAIKSAIRSALQRYKWMNLRALPTLKTLGSKPTQRFKLTAPEARLMVMALQYLTAIGFQLCVKSPIWLLLQTRCLPLYSAHQIFTRFKNSTPERYGNDPVAKWKQIRKNVILPGPAGVHTAAEHQEMALANEPSTQQIRNQIATPHQEVSFTNIPPIPQKRDTSGSRAKSIEKRNPPSLSESATLTIPSAEVGLGSPTKQRRTPRKTAKTKKKRKKNAPVSSEFIDDSDDALKSPAVEDTNTLTTRTLTRRSPYRDKARSAGSRKSGEPDLRAGTGVINKIGNQCSPADGLAPGSESVESSSVLATQPTAPSEDELSDSDEDTVMGPSTSRTPFQTPRRRGQERGKGRISRSKATPGRHVRGANDTLSIERERDIFSEDEMLDTDDDDFAMIRERQGFETTHGSVNQSISGNLNSPQSSEQETDGFEEDQLSESEEDEHQAVDPISIPRRGAAPTHRSRRTIPVAGKVSTPSHGTRKRITKTKPKTGKTPKTTKTPRKKRPAAKRHGDPATAHGQERQTQPTYAQQPNTRASNRPPTVPSPARQVITEDGARVAMDTKSAADGFEEDSLPETDEDNSPKHNSARTPNIAHKLREKHRRITLDRRKPTPTTMRLRRTDPTSTLISDTPGAARTIAVGSSVDSNLFGTRKHRLKSFSHSQIPADKFEEDDLSESEDDSNALAGDENPSTHKRARVDSYSPIDKVGGAASVANLSPDSDSYLKNVNSTTSPPGADGRSILTDHSRERSYKSCTSQYRKRDRNQDRNQRANYDQDQLSETDKEDGDDTDDVHGASSEGYGVRGQVYNQYTPAEMGLGASQPLMSFKTHNDSPDITSLARSAKPGTRGGTANEIEAFSNRERERGCSDGPVPHTQHDIGESDSQGRPSIEGGGAMPSQNGIPTRKSDYKLNASSSRVGTSDGRSDPEDEFACTTGVTSGEQAMPVERRATHTLPSSANPTSQSLAHTFDVSDLSDTDEE